jgi:alpha-N-arabinofuranosidase
MDNLKIIETHLTRALDLAKAHSSYDHKIQVVFDEWGTWYKEATVEAGNFQQSTMRDAIYAAACFHLFHKCGEDLIMTNIAQTVNILQALILTKGQKMVCTPTYYVYDLFKPHRGGYVIPSKLKFENRVDEKENKSISVSVTQNENILFISIINFDLNNSYKLKIDINSHKNFKIENISTIYSNDIHDHNTFEDPDKVVLKNIDFNSGDEYLTIQPHSVTGIKMIEGNYIK